MDRLDCYVCLFTHMLISSTFCSPYLSLPAPYLLTSASSTIEHFLLMWAQRGEIHIVLAFWWWYWHCIWQSLWTRYWDWWFCSLGCTISRLAHNFFKKIHEPYEPYYCMNHIIAATLATSGSIHTAFPAPTPSEMLVIMTLCIWCFGLEMHNFGGNEWCHFDNALMSLGHVLFASTIIRL